MKTLGASRPLLRQRATHHCVLVLIANHAAPVGDWPSAGGSAHLVEPRDTRRLRPEAGEALVMAQRGSGGWTGTVVKLGS